MSTPSACFCVSSRARAANVLHNICCLGLTRFAGVRCGEAPRANDSPSLPYGLLLREHGAAATCSISQLSKEFAMTVLRQRMTEDMQVRNLSPNTQLSYLQQVSKPLRDREAVGQSCAFGEVGTTPTVAVAVPAREALTATAWSGCLQRIPSRKGAC